jgi:hypothetical protein
MRAYIQVALRQGESLRYTLCRRLFGLKLPPSSGSRFSTEGEGSSFCETLVPFYVITRRYNPETRNMNNNRREKLRTYNSET